MKYTNFKKKCALENEAIKNLHEEENTPIYYFNLPSDTKLEYRLSTTARKSICYMPSKRTFIESIIALLEKDSQFMSILIPLLNYGGQIESNGTNCRIKFSDGKPFILFDRLL